MTANLCNSLRLATSTRDPIKLLGGVLKSMLTLNEAIIDVKEG